MLQNLNFTPLLFFLLALKASVPSVSMKFFFLSSLFPTGNSDKRGIKVRAGGS